MSVVIAFDVPRTMDKKTCRFIPNHNVYVVLLMNCFEEVRLSMLQEGAERITRERHRRLELGSQTSAR